jgi:hypothetical protein
MATEVAREARGRERRGKVERTPVEAEKTPSASDWGTLRRAPTSKVAEHAVFLVPGLLGFERISTFSYFADRVASTLRASLERAWQQPVPVVAVPVPPTASLQQRQRRLAKTLADRLHDLEHGQGTLHVHLVGHSTGGVDADLLTRMTPVGGGTWRDVDPRAPELVARIRSVTSIASPHQGACLAVDPVARFLRGRDVSALPAFAKLVGKFAWTSLGDVDLEHAVDSAHRQALKTARFVSDALSTWALLGDLDPARLPGSGERRPGVQRRSFVTLAGRPVPGRSVSQPDAFFRELSSRATGWSTGAAERGELIATSVKHLQAVLASPRADEWVIKAEGTALPTSLDAGHNDGVVNSARQLATPDDPNELAGIVVADHFDVVGYYDRQEWTVDADGHERQVPIVSGLLHSGSGFRDDQFFELYRRMAEVIASSVTQ